ncbi:VOC family protein [Roseovarius tolerans]|uniref:VOC family protein n=1 Tax=Roseovarius tolerans TaxID=74031 RepID=UPI001C31DA25|nr:VOC family protein [Roseovarius tolerans]
MTFDPEQFRFHHIGVACRRIECEQRGWAALGYAPEGARFEDPLQGVAGIFMKGSGPRVELLEELPGSETLTPFLEVGTKMYHQAFEVPDLDRGMAHLQHYRAKALSPPKPAVAFGGRRVVFLMLPTRLIAELIEME